MIADDDRYSYMLLSHVITKTGAQILYAKDGQEAMRILHSEQRISIAILDIFMPGHLGYQVIQQSQHRLTGTHFFAYTAFTDVHTRNMCKAVGFAHCFFKPTLPAKIMEVVDETIQCRKFNPA